MTANRFVRSALATLLLFGFASPSLAQAVRTGWEFAGVPSVNYDSDEGFGYGASAEIYNYGRMGLRPYRYTIQPNIFFTTEGRRDLTLFVDAPRLLPDGWRVDAFAGSEHHVATPFYGLGNDTPHDLALEAEANPYYYRFGRTSNQVRMNVQRPLGNTPLRILLGGGVAHVAIDPVPHDLGTTLLAETFESVPEGWSNSVRGGLIWDTRDREVGPRRGVWSDLLVQRVDRALGSDWSYTRVTLTDRRYFPVASRVTFAQRVLLQSVTGDAPFFDLYTVQSSFKPQEGLGGSKTIRGIPKNRFVGNGMLVSNSEIRWRAADFRAVGRPMHLVASTFVDAGRVWKDEIKLGEVATDLHWGVGGGLRLGMGDNFLVAVDIGHSREATAPFYIGLGYLY